MELTRDEQFVVRRAVAAYHEAKEGHKGAFGRTTADEVLEELKPSPIRWVALAAFVIEAAEGTRKYPASGPSSISPVSLLRRAEP
ncbi:MAG TPA: hypothetical protein EYO97_00940 [Gemmatimonadetes bacterium]|nr:hypothetical protein [Gemmatimonadota bacterium]